MYAGNRVELRAMTGSCGASRMVQAFKDEGVDRLRITGEPLVRKVAFLYSGYEYAGFENQSHYQRGLLKRWREGEESGYPVVSTDSLDEGNILDHPGRISEGFRV